MKNYVCDECGNTLDASFAVETWVGPKGTVAVLPGSVECRNEQHDSPRQMKLEVTPDE